MVGALAEEGPEERHTRQATGDSTTPPQLPIIGHGPKVFPDLGAAGREDYSRPTSG